MNILWFTWKDRSNPLAGGAEVVNEELARRLAADGHTVTLLVAGYPGAAPTDSRHGFHIIRAGSRLTAYWAAARYYRRHQSALAPDLVIDECNTIPYFAGWYTGRPTVMFFHMLCRQIWFSELPQPFSTIGYLLEPLYLRLLKRGPVIAMSPSTRQDLIRHGFAPSAIHLISEGIELTPLASLAHTSKPPQPTILSLGAMRAMKRTLHQIQAFELAKARLPDLQLHIAGDAAGRYGQKVLRAIAASPHAADIHYHGRVTPEAKIALIQSAHLILSTAVKEGWGLTITEAASQGTPAVAYDADGLRDSIRTGQTGLLTAANTPQALAESITRLLSDPARYQTIRQAAWEWSQDITFDHSYVDFKQALAL